MKLRIKKGDNVKIIKGKDRGKQGKVIKIYTDNNKILVEGLNIFKKSQKPKKSGEKGEIVSISKPINVSNAMFICGSCGKAARIGYKFEENKKNRFCKKCKAVI